MKRFFSFLFIILFPAQTAHALQIEDVGGLLGLGTADPDQVLANLITTVLGLLGLLAVIMVIIGGFRWMLSGGDEEKVARAKKTISGSIIGVVLILLSWAIVSFVINTAANVTGAV